MSNTPQVLEPADDSPKLRSRDAIRDKLVADREALRILLVEAGDAMMASEITIRLGWSKVRPGQLVHDFPNTFASWSEERQGKRIGYIDLVPDLRNPRTFL